jgi:hypothetical protein
MGSHQLSSSSQTQLAQDRSAQLGVTPELQLRTASAANLAYLDQDGTGRVHMYFREFHYGVDDYVPDSLTASRSLPPSGTVGVLLFKQMLTHYRYHEDGWPALASQLLLQHTTGQSAKQS